MDAHEFFEGQHARNKEIQEAKDNLVKLATEDIKSFIEHNLAKGMKIGLKFGFIAGLVLSLIIYLIIK